LELQWDGPYLNGVYPGEFEEAVSAESLAGHPAVGTKAHIEQEALERTAGERRGNPETMAAAETVRRRSGSFHSEDKEISGVVSGGVEQRVEHLPLIGSPLDVDVFRGSGPHRQAQVQGKPTLEQPLRGRHRNQSRQQAVESDPLAFADDLGVLSGSIFQALLERLTK